MTHTEAAQFIRALRDRGYTAELRHVRGDTYTVRIPEIPFTIATPRQARFILKYLKPLNHQEG